MKKKKSLDKIAKILLPLATTIFIAVLLIMFWNFMVQYKYVVLAVTGAVIIFFALLGYFKPKKFKRSLRKKLI